MHSTNTKETQKEEYKMNKKKVSIKRVFIVVYLLALGIVLFRTGMEIGEAGGVKAWHKNKIEKNYEEKLKNYDVVEVVIKEGDSAWLIQEKLTPNERDMREALNLSEYVNGKDLGKIKPGEVVLFVKEKKKK